MRGVLVKLLVTLLTLALLVTGCGNSTAGTSDPGPLGLILDTAPNDPRGGTFSSALKHPSLANLRRDLTGEGPYTVFLPTNAAFDTYFAEQGVTKEAFLASDDAAEVVRAHIVAGNHPYTEISRGATLRNLNGDSLTTELKGNVFYVNEAEVDGPIDGRPFNPGQEIVQNGSFYTVLDLALP